MVLAKYRSSLPLRLLEWEPTSALHPTINSTLCPVQSKRASAKQSPTISKPTMITESIRFDQMCCPLESQANLIWPSDVNVIVHVRLQTVLPRRKRGRRYVAKLRFVCRLIRLLNPVEFQNDGVELDRTLKRWDGNLRLHLDALHLTLHFESVVQKPDWLDRRFRSGYCWTKRWSSS